MFKGISRSVRPAVAVLAVAIVGGGLGGYLGVHAAVGGGGSSSSVLLSTPAASATPLATAPLLTPSTSASPLLTVPLPSPSTVPVPTASSCAIPDCVGAFNGLTISG